MSKPASGTTLNTGHALYTSLAAAWGMLEGTGSTSADSKGSRTLTLGTGCSWSTNGSGEAVLSFAGTGASPATPASALVLTNAQDWTIAWRGKLASSSSNAGMVCGDNTNTTDFLWMNAGVGGPTLQCRDHGSNDANGTATAPDLTTTADYCISRNAGSNRIDIYRNGVSIGSSTLWTSGSLGALTINTIGNGYTSTTFAFTGTLEYLYVWQGRALNSTDAGTVSGTPYVLFATNAAPSTPTISAGTPTSTGVTLTGSAFSDPDSDTHAASQWQVTTSADTGFASAVISTGDDSTNKTSYAATGLSASTAYRARVRYKDSAGNYSSYATDVTFTTAAANNITITSPVAYQFRWWGTGRTSATHTLAGTYGGTPGGAIEWSLDNTTWSTLVSSPTGGTYTGTVSVPTGVYTLRTRWASDHSVAASVANVITGPVIGTSGQSLSTGRGTNNQTVYLPSGLAAGLKTATGYAVMADPYASTIDSGTGSFAPPMVSALAQLLNVPIGVVPCGVGGTSITEWQPAGTYYNAMVARLNSVGGCDVLFWWQGESDAVAGMSQATYHTNLAAMIAGIRTDVGCPVMPCALELMDTGTATQPHQDSINAAIVAAWSDVTGCVRGPDFRMIPTEPEDTLHLKTDAKLCQAGALIAARIYEAVFQPSGGTTTIFCIEG